MKMLRKFLILCMACQINGQAFHIKFVQSPSHACTILEENFLKTYRGFETLDQNEFKVSKRPAISYPADTQAELKDHSSLIEVYAKNKNIGRAYQKSLCHRNEPIPKLRLSSRVKAEPEIRKIIDGGEPKNRIDVVFMGDGYTASERDQFFSDIERLTKDMFEGDTFRSYLPLFNIWAIYVESEESGIGYFGAPKNTPFKLYRESGELRVIWPGDRDYARQVCDMVGESGCDFPSLIANDDYYGGLGGEFVISTKSNRTGTVVLRHEMGHSFIEVGDEYDNSPTYYGVNSAKTVGDLGWTAWLTNGLREERSIYRLLEYPWKDLKEGPQTFIFESDGLYSRWYLLLSVSAAGETDSLEFSIDGEILPWNTTGFDDREFYSWTGYEGFTSGRHTFSVRSKTNSTHPDIPRMICSINLHEFGDESEFEMGMDTISAYPTWDLGREKVYRPTNGNCLMRNMTHTRFCSVCQEGMWMKFLEKVSLIDYVVGGEKGEDGLTEVMVSTLKLGQFREGTIEGEKLEIKWFKEGVEMEEWRDQVRIRAGEGRWRVEVHFVTREVRNDPRGYLTSSEEFTV